MKAIHAASEAIRAVRLPDTPVSDDLRAASGAVRQVAACLESLSKELALIESLDGNGTVFLTRDPRGLQPWLSNRKGVKLPLCGLSSPSGAIRIIPDE